MKEFKVNDYITVKFENRETFIYVSGKRFIQCIRLVLNIPIADVQQYDEIDSIDEAAGIYNKHIYQNRIVQGPMARNVPDISHDIIPEQEFWWHCSNIQAWAENNYDTRFLDSKLSFALLKKLTEVGDPIAKKVFKEEIAKRLTSGYVPVIKYLIKENYINYLSKEELEFEKATFRLEINEFGNYVFHPYDDYRNLRNRRFNSVKEMMEQLRTDIKITIKRLNH
ncbi:MAG: hypothetical protein EU540_05545 [Promethearchaeota archaeon]|nr:MAG: hypothetical protein EU540_05545 [Candidatus Lokiarchaeota archaeon]